MSSHTKTQVELSSVFLGSERKFIVQRLNTFLPENNEN